RGRRRACSRTCGLGGLRQDRERRAEPSLERRSVDVLSRELGDRAASMNVGKTHGRERETDFLQCFRRGAGGALFGSLLLRVLPLLPAKVTSLSDLLATISVLRPELIVRATAYTQILGFVRAATAAGFRVIELEKRPGFAPATLR